MNVISLYPNYNVSFEGIGKGPEGTEHLGCCSQMAVFTLKNDNLLDNSNNTQVMFCYFINLYEIDKCIIVENLYRMLVNHMNFFRPSSILSKRIHAMKIKSFLMKLPIGLVT